MNNTNEKRKIRWILGGVIIALTVVGLSFLKLGDEMVYFYTPDEVVLKAKSLQEDTIKMGGMVMKDSVVWNPETLSLKFTITNMQGINIEVQHRGTPPDLFKEESGVVAEGKISEDGKIFNSRKLMVKHSEEYRKPDDHTKMDRALLEQSIFKE